MPSSASGLTGDHAWTWYEPSQRYDQDGPKAGVYYDGKLTKADGKGKWWEGYDPKNSMPRTTEGLVVNLPQPCNKIAPVLRITK